MLPKPVSCECRRLIQRPWFFEQMAGAGNNLELALGLKRKLSHSGIIQIQDYSVFSSNDKEGRRQHTL